MNVSPTWLDIAEEDLRRDVKEIPGPESHQRIAQALASTTLGETSDEIPWCSAIVNLWMLDASIRLAVDLQPTRSARARSWLFWGLKVDRLPPYGAVCILNRAGGPMDASILEAPGHVGIYCGMDQWGEFPQVNLLGGNQSDRVCRRRYPLSQVLGFRWPT